MVPETAVRTNSKRFSMLTFFAKDDLAIAIGFLFTTDECFDVVEQTHGSILFLSLAALVFIEIACYGSPIPLSEPQPIIYQRSRLCEQFRSSIFPEKQFGQHIHALKGIHWFGILPAIQYEWSP